METNEVTGTFRLHLELGNAAACTPRDVAEMMRRTADRIETMGDLRSREATPVLDINGNTVGFWLAELDR